MVRYVKLYWLSIKMNIKIMMQYKVDTLIGAFSTLFMQLSTIIFLDAIFNHITDCGGWSYEQVLLIYGVFTLCRGLNHIFFDNLWIVGKEFIRKGTFDVFLTRPANELFLLVSQKIQPDGIGTLVLGMVISLNAWVQLNIQITMQFVGAFLITILLGMFIIATINWIFAVSSFWVINSNNIIWVIFSAADFAQYPLSIFSPILKCILTFIVPYGFVSYYPVTYLLGKQDATIFVQEAVILLVLLIIANLLWRFGLKKYESAGN